MTALRIFASARPRHVPARVLPIDPAEQAVLDELRRRRAAVLDELCPRRAAGQPKKEH